VSEDGMAYSLGRKKNAVSEIQQDKVLIRQNWDIFGLVLLFPFLHQLTRSWNLGTKRKLKQLEK
jgi:hypothetical protein